MPRLTGGAYQGLIEWTNPLKHRRNVQRRAQAVKFVKRVPPADTINNTVLGGADVEKGVAAGMTPSVWDVVTTWR